MFDHTEVHIFYFIYFGAFYDWPDTYNYNFLFYFHPQDRKRDYEVRKMKQDFDKQQTVQKRRTEEVNSHKVKQSKVHHPPQSLLLMFGDPGVTYILVFQSITIAIIATLLHLVYLDLVTHL